MSEDLCPENDALMRENRLNELALLRFGGYTPKVQEIATVLIAEYRALITAQEYVHPVVSREVCVSRATEGVERATKALKQALIYEIKQARGDWIAMA